MQKILFTAVTALAVSLSAAPASAVVSFTGSLEDNPNTFEIGRWSRTSVVKTFDIDGDNYYGTDGYTWMNNGTSGSKQAVFANLVESAPSYLAGGIAYTGAGTGMSGGASGAFNGSENRLTPTDTPPSVNVGYAGVDYANGDAGVTILQEVFAYTMSRDMASVETIRIGVVLDSLADPQIGADALRIVAGGDAADATIVGDSRNGSMDMYFFDITGLSQGDEIEIWLSNATASSATFNAATIGGVTFDTTLPEPSTAVLLGLGGLALLRRRRAIS